MNYRQLTGSVVCGVAASALAVAPVLAQNDTMMTGTATDATATAGATSADTNMAGSTTMAPMPLSGQVVRYYTDRAGYVTAMDVQTSDGVRMVRFAPDMSQRLYTTYPPGGMVDVYVVGSPFHGDTRYDVVGIGKEVPRAGYMQPYMVRDVDFLEADPYIEIGAEQKTVTGILSRVITSDKGDVLALVLADNTLVRVPREVRAIAPGHTGSSRVTPLFKGARVVATGYDEAPRFGVVSSYPRRVAARAIVVNGRSVGGVGFPRYITGVREPLIDATIDDDATAEQMKAVNMGYYTYPGTVTTTETTVTTTTPATAPATE